MNTREEYEQKAQAKLNALNAEINKLKIKAAEAEADAKIQYTQEVDKLSFIKNQLSEKLTKLKDAGKSDWEDTKSDFEKLSNSAENTLRSVISKFQ